MKVHVLGFPHTETTAEWSACAFTSRTADFATMMTQQGYETILYAGERNDAPCTEHVPLVTRAQQRTWYPGFDRTRVFNEFDPNQLPWRVFNARAISEISKRCSPGDLLAITMGTSHRHVAEGLPDLIHCETGVGYSGVWAPYRVFESNAWRHFMAAKEPTDDLRWFDTVIPRGYFSDRFTPGAGGQDFLFMGRLTGRKGPKVAADVCQAIGARLLIAGQGVAKVEPGRVTTDEGVVLEGDVTYLGVLTPEERAIVMGSVAAVLMPTFYLEPGGGVAIESQLVGTPVITTPWGAMTETVLEGRTGFHCSTLSEFVKATGLVLGLNRKEIARSARRRFDAMVTGRKYDEYFKKLSTVVSGQGWYQL